MENLEPQITYPRFLQCTKVEFEAHEKSACELLGYSNELATSYCNPIIDKNGAYFFTINSEVCSLFSEEQILSAVEFDKIEFPPSNIKNI
jgi:hypothetical protein